MKRFNQLVPALLVLLVPVFTPLHADPPIAAEKATVAEQAETVRDPVEKADTVRGATSQPVAPDIEFITIGEVTVPATASNETLSADAIRALHHEAHELQERNDPNAKGMVGLVSKLAANWNYFRTLRTQVRIAHALGETPDSEAKKHILNSGVVALGTHALEHVVGHGMHFAASYSSNPAVQWTGAVVGEAIASPFVEVVCIAGGCLYANSPRFQDGVTKFRLGAYKALEPAMTPIVKGLGLDKAWNAVMETRSGQEQMMRALAGPVGQKFAIHAADETVIKDPDSGKEIARMTSHVLSNGNVTLDTLKFNPKATTDAERAILKKATTTIFGRDIAEAVISSHDAIKKDKNERLESEVFYQGRETAEDGATVLAFKPNSLRRTSWVAVKDDVKRSIASVPSQICNTAMGALRRAK